MSTAQSSTITPLLIFLAGIVGLMLGVVIGYMLYQSVGKRSIEKKINQILNREAERATHAERERMNSVFSQISSITATLTYQRVLNNALDMAANLLGKSNAPADRLVSAVLLFNQNGGRPTELCVGSARRFTPADTRITLPGMKGLVAETIETGEPCLSDRISQDPELVRIIALRVCTVAYCIPLRIGLDTYGVLLFAYPDKDYFTADRREVLKQLAGQAVIAIQNARLYHDLELEKERMQEVQEEARKKLARDLHDGPTQSVAAIAMRVNFARRLIERDQKATAEELSKIEDLARRTTKEIRHMLFTLRPLVLESQGLIAALEAMAEKMKETYNQNVIISADPAVIPNIEIGKQAVIFYIAEEAVNNARKHAQAAHVWIRLKSIQEDMALLEIEDDGVGFNIGAIDAYYDKRGSLGMVNMRERAELVNGALHIDSAEGKGTRVSLAIPLSEEAADRLRNRT